MFSFCDVEDRVDSCSETALREEKLVLTVNGYPEHYDLIKCN